MSKTERPYILPSTLLRGIVLIDLSNEQKA